MSRTRWFDVAAIALALSVIVGLLFALRPEATATIAVDPSTAYVDRPKAAEAPTHPSVLFIGDSYTAGGGLPEMSYGCVAAVRMGWLCNLSAVPGTGYTSGGPGNRFEVSRYLGTSTSYAERITNLADVYQPDVVVLDGGRNDRNDENPPTESVFKAMTATIEHARRNWPEATIIFIRPRFLAEPNNDLGFTDGVIRRLEAEPAAQGMVVIDPISRFSGADTSALLSTDRIHPNAQGYRELASALFDSLVAQQSASTS